jgi:hypothetical protein
VGGEYPDEALLLPCPSIGGISTLTVPCSHWWVPCATHRPLSRCPPPPPPPKPLIGYSQALSILMANGTYISPAIARSDGSDSLVFSGNNFTDNPSVVLTTPLAEPVGPTGYEEKHGGNYDLTVPYFVSPTPSPTPVPTMPLEQAYLLGAAGAGVTPWRTVYPIRNDAPIYVPVGTGSPNLVVAPVVANHAAGYYVRVRVRSTVDRSYVFTDRIWVPFFRPTLQEVYPPSLPRGGAVVNLLGHSFGTGGRVLIRQHTSTVSPTTLGDGAYQGLHALVGAAAGVGAPAFVDLNCLLLAWDQSRIRCLAPPGADPNATIVIDLGVSSAAYPGLVYRDAVPCRYTFTYSDAAVDVPYPTFLEEYQLGVWAGLAFGLGLWLALGLLLNKVANRDPRILFEPSDALSVAPVPGPKGKAPAGAPKPTLLDLGEVGAGATKAPGPLTGALARAGAGAGATGQGQAPGAPGATGRESKASFHNQGDGPAAGAVGGSAGDGVVTVGPVSAEPSLLTDGSVEGSVSSTTAAPPPRRSGWLCFRGKARAPATAEAALAQGSASGGQSTPTREGTLDQEAENRRYLEALSPLSDSMLNPGGAPGVGTGAGAPTGDQGDGAAGRASVATGGTADDAEVVEEEGPLSAEAAAARAALGELDHPLQHMTAADGFGGLGVGRMRRGVFGAGRVTALWQQRFPTSSEESEGGDGEQ